MNAKTTAKINEKKSISSTLTLLIALVVLWIAFSLLTPYFFGARNINNLLKYSSVMGIAASGVLIVIISGGLDLSIGSTVALTGMMSALAMSKVDIWYVGVLAGLATALVCGVINAGLITVVKINPFITGLGTMTIFRGLCFLVNRALSISITNNAYKFIGQGTIGGFPLIILIMALMFVIVGFVLKYTKFGRHVYSVGGNAQASYLAGINIKKARFKIYLLSALMAGIAGICQSSLTGTASPSAASELVMVCISSVILGGASLAGGKGNIFGTIIGVILLGTISNGLTLLNLSQYYQDITRGIILLLAVSLDTIKGKGAYN